MALPERGAVVALPGDDGETLRVETPIALIFSDGNYYLESYSDPPWRHGEKAMRSRIDRMTLLRVSDVPADDCAEVRKLKRTATRRISRDFSMLAGAPRTVFPQVMSRKINEMIDQFGFGLKYGQFEGEAGVETSTAIACVRTGRSSRARRRAARESSPLPKLGQITSEVFCLRVFRRWSDRMR